MNVIRHVDIECRSNTEEGAPAKQQRTMTDDIMFQSRNADRVEAPTIYPMVISAMIDPVLVRKILIDHGSSVNIIFKKTYDQMLLEGKDLKPCKARIHNFNCIATEAVCRATGGIERLQS